MSCFFYKDERTEYYEHIHILERDRQIVEVQNSHLK